MPVKSADLKRLSEWVRTSFWVDLAYDEESVEILGNLDLPESWKRLRRLSRMICRRPTRRIRPQEVVRPLHRDQTSANSRRS